VVVVTVSPTVVLVVAVVHVVAAMAALSVVRRVSDPEQCVDADRYDPDL
jgi:hypothetical protein